MRSLPVLLPLLLLAACRDADEPDAYGNFQATETTVSSQAAGPLVAFGVDEGDRLGAGDRVGLVDTIPLVLQRDQLLAQRRSLEAQRASILAQSAASMTQRTATLATGAETDAAAGVIAAQLQTAEEELARSRRLLADEAATPREVNEREGAVQALRAQLRQAQARQAAVGAQAAVPAAQAQVARAQAAGLDGQIAGINAQINALDDRIGRSAVVNPVAGTVLTVIARRGEVVAAGSPLYRIADVDTLTLRAYATGEQLPRLRLGMTVEVRVDDGRGGLATHRGMVRWIAPQAEFTPTPVQTRDARASLVYAFDVRVPNPAGALKVGMPGEVRFPVVPR